jgi:hypothetical protein
MEELEPGAQVYIGSRPAVIMGAYRHEDYEVITVFRPPQGVPLPVRPGDFSTMFLTLFKPGADRGYFLAHDLPAPLRPNLDEHRHVHVHKWLEALRIHCRDPFAALR